MVTKHVCDETYQEGLDRVDRLGQWVKQLSVVGRFMVTGLYGKEDCDHQEC